MKYSNDLNENIENYSKESFGIDNYFESLKKNFINPQNEIKILYEENSDLIKDEITQNFNIERIRRVSHCTMTGN